MPLKAVSKRCWSPTRPRAALSGARPAGAGAGGVVVDQVILPDGEQYKSLAVLDQVFSALLENRTGATRR